MLEFFIFETFSATEEYTEVVEKEIITAIYQAREETRKEMELHRRLP